MRQLLVWQVYQFDFRHPLFASHDSIPPIDGTMVFGQPDESDKDARASSGNPGPAESGEDYDADVSITLPNTTRSLPGSRRNSRESVIAYASRFIIRNSRRKISLLSTSPTVAVSEDIDKHGAKTLPERVIRNPYQRSFAVMMYAMGITVAMSAYQEILLEVGISGCGRESIFQEECESIAFMFITVPMLFRQLMCYCAITYILFSQLYAIRVCRRMVIQGRQMSGTDLPPSHVRIVTGHWTGAASPDILDDVSNMVEENQLLALVISGMTTVVITVATVRLRVLEWHKGDASDIVAAMCCAEAPAGWHADRCSNACKWGVLAHVPCLTFSVGLLVFFVCSTVFIPSNLWSPLTIKALNKRRRPHMRRMLRVLMITGVLWAIVTSLFLIYVAAQFRVSNASFWIGVLVFDITAALTHFGVVLWAIGWHSPAAVLCSIRRFTTKIYKATFHGNEMRNKIGGLDSWFGSGHARRYTQLVLGACGMFAFAVDSWGSDHRTAAVELWIVRSLILLLMVLFSRDLEADFDMLEKGQGAGFGLLLDARQLRKALKCHLAGHQYLGRVKRYRGTLLRMCDTMAISYRWQDSIIQIEGLGTVNMSNWQMESVVEAIRSSGCLYVWLDAFAVPQMGNFDLKKILLSRMMAVYASSFVTAVLLSCEEESGRYHQRVWTLQEYCSSRQLMVYEEEPTAEGHSSSGKTAVEEGEAETAKQLRREHTARQPWCEPVWINSSVVATLQGMTAEDSKQIWETYKNLRNTLFCKFPEDTIRALYPLLWNRPAESQVELIQLIKALKEVHGIPQQRSQIRMFKKSTENLMICSTSSIISGTGSIVAWGEDYSLDSVVMASQSAGSSVGWSLPFRGTSTLRTKSETTLLITSSDAGASWGYHLPDSILPDEASTPKV